MAKRCSGKNASLLQSQLGVAVEAEAAAAAAAADTAVAAAAAAVATVAVAVAAAAAATAVTVVMITAAGHHHVATHASHAATTGTTTVAEVAVAVEGTTATMTVAAITAADGRHHVDTAAVAEVTTSDDGRRQGNENGAEVRRAGGNGAEAQVVVEDEAFRGCCSALRTPLTASSLWLFCRGRLIDHLCCTLYLEKRREADRQWALAPFCGAYRPDADRVPCGGTLCSWRCSTPGPQFEIASQYLSVSCSISPGAGKYLMHVAST